MTSLKEELNWKEAYLLFSPFVYGKTPSSAHLKQYGNFKITNLIKIVKRSKMSFWGDGIFACPGHQIAKIFVSGFIFSAMQVF